MQVALNSIATVPLSLENVPCAVSPVGGSKDLKAIEDLLDLIPSTSREADIAYRSALPLLVRLRMNAIRLNVSCSDWRSAIREAGRVLMECGSGETVPVDIIMMLAINDPSAQIDMLRKVSL